ncbi:hypothetical protein GPECTOR_449g346 [Gonium pectorale]|uniref:Non-structural maintenance of chromosomes element 1 homolog n=1 Tax=Gonium pectorale TaxID=33097 RepID=A0A150FWQ2_GONPE|nr:hypothetical protein GPECTOR_449g346 [Gonium pectorale]|eukprot:KXZ41470.1 hypothetical protein GPECTOR_449g346 [Gonium pectorale]
MTLAQAMIGAGFMHEDDFKAGGGKADGPFLQILTALQQEVRFLDLGIERIRLPADGGWYVCLVDKERDEVSKQHGAKYSPEGVMFIRAVVEAIASAQPPAGKLLAELSMIQLVNLDVKRPTAAAAEGGTQAARSVRKIPLKDKSILLEEFTRDGWLHESRTGYYTLGPRTLGELKDLVLSLVSDEVADKLRNDYM